MAVYLVTDRASCPFWVRGDGEEPERYRLSPQAAAGSASPVLRVLLTTVLCLSNWSRKRPAACCTAAFLTLALPTIPSCSPLIDDSLVFLGTGEGLRGSPHPHRHTLQAAVG